MDDSLPVTLVWETYVEGDALNAGKYLYHSVAELLKSKGVAYDTYHSLR